MIRSLTAAFALSALMLTAANAADFTVKSETFKNGAVMPKSVEFIGFACDGGNQSPQLSWSGAPAGTKSFVITQHDPDAPTTVGWWHWTVYNIPATVNALPAGASKSAALPKGALEGLTDYGTTGFGGACPPKGDKPHRYNTTVYALSVEKFDMPAETMTGAKLMFLIKDVTLGKATITGLYGR
ncbi:MAG: YbhB/YbcL family Raf kinase inhibitor-like protein [Alphaproteobacteria bacterium]|jgi:Raf kinase inhibitor-like YbhB/YbcL family protein|nr:YbhB/YbcL family Raf kinase inhibitor-like protein [Thalassospira sp.]MCE2965657.1 YbhB/YbcL family Raf kinase inhibitor-like protein [Alphaproteobacteria bacterium]